MLTQLAEWTRLGFLAKTGPGRYALPGPSGQATASAAPAAGQQDPAPAGIIAAATEAVEAAATRASPPAPLPAPAGTSCHRRQAGPAPRAAHGPGILSGPASRSPSAETATASTKLRPANNRDCTPALKPCPHTRTLSCLLPAP